MWLFPFLPTALRFFPCWLAFCRPIFPDSHVSDDDTATCTSFWSLAHRLKLALWRENKTEWSVLVKLEELASKCFYRMHWWKLSSEIPNVITKVFHVLMNCLRLESTRTEEFSLLNFKTLLQILRVRIVAQEDLKFRDIM